MRSSTRMLWWRVVLGGFLAEVLVFAAVIPVFRTLGQEAVLYVAPVASFVACFFLAWWASRKADGRFVVHGVLVGLVATLLYVALTKAGPEPVAYLIAHGLKIVGGGLGGFVAGRRRSLEVSRA